MKGFKGTLIKEILLLIRDIPGLILLFVMPMVLILVVTLTQENAFKSITESRIAMILVNNDKKDLGNVIENGLRKSNTFDIMDQINGAAPSAEEADVLIASGKYQVGIIIQHGATEKAQQRADAIMSKTTDSTKRMMPQVSDTSSNIILSFDPTLRDSYKNSVTISIRRLIQSAEFQIMLNRFFNDLPLRLNELTKQPVKRELIRQLGLMEKEVNSELKKRMGQYFPNDLKIEAPDKDPDIDLKEEFAKNLTFKFETDSENLVILQERYAAGKGDQLKPTLVQNNVPAFALFAMFFIVIPLAGSLITERNQGTYSRLKTLPVKYITILTGKAFIYILVCLSQLALMILTGMFLLPLLSGLPPLVLGTSYISIIIAAISCSLAAIGFGLLVGTFATSQSQAGMFGSFMVVILGILGGIFLPVHMMPHQLQIITMLSPVRWGIDSFLDLFVRNGSLKTIWPNILLLNMFFAIALIIAMFNFVRRK
jgi:ABC-2 type transport system permease protein